ncbi:TPA: DUF2560 family protein [Raoultella ornithinolytica]|nr:DUF2560 family protein [Raoultella ornithinolytica]HDT5909850.1 DUF2560 family protein [Raoultella ornithinolytica]HDT5917604.1 DUF2560 family protein [Raoultella ornithinolytica]HDT5965630.1 DUF2560 family protein [Raoultella ornithinolytica]HDT6008217.1 DUF2560 family protein [Raoultella ornithinolytica]
MDQLTDKETVIFSILDYVGDDQESTAKAVAFIGDSRVKYQLFTRCYNKVGDGTVIEKTDAAIQSAAEMAVLFN